MYSKLSTRLALPFLTSLMFTISARAGEAPPKRELPAGVHQIHLLITGRVQGVGFRDFTQRTAEKLGILGWVRNLAGGEVELCAQGPDDKLKEFTEKVSAGPSSAKVEKVEQVKSDLEELGKFEVRESTTK